MANNIGGTFGRIFVGTVLAFFIQFLAACWAAFMVTTLEWSACTLGEIIQTISCDLLDCWPHFGRMFGRVYGGYSGVVRMNMECYRSTNFI